MPLEVLFVGALFLFLGWVFVFRRDLAETMQIPKSQLDGPFRPIFGWLALILGALACLPSTAAKVAQFLNS